MANIVWAEDFYVTVLIYSLLFDFQKFHLWFSRFTLKGLWIKFWFRTEQQQKFSPLRKPLLNSIDFMKDNNNTKHFDFINNYEINSNPVGTPECFMCTVGRINHKTRRFSRLYHSHKLHLLALLVLLGLLSEKTDFPALSYTSFSEIPTLSYTWSLKKVFLSGEASYRPLWGVPRGLQSPA